MSSRIVPVPPYRVPVRGDSSPVARLTRLALQQQRRLVLLSSGNIPLKDFNVRQIAACKIKLV